MFGEWREEELYHLFLISIWLYRSLLLPLDQDRKRLLQCLLRSRHYLAPRSYLSELWCRALIVTNGLARFQTHNLTFQGVRNAARRIGDAERCRSNVTRQIDNRYDLSRQRSG
jgi:hypothetical protein